MKTVIKKHQCSGCGLCYASCPKSAISMREDKEGFYYPYIDSKKCINCNICTSICPNLKEETSFKEKEWFIYQSDVKHESNSSSGGVFPLIAEHIIDNGGYVCGASLYKEHDFVCEHKIINDLKDIKELQGSKYIQSKSWDTYKNIKVLLENGKTVLFVGTPCQVVALKTFLRKDYKQLITIDLLCFGVLSNKVFLIYIKQLEKKTNSTVKNVFFRKKVKDKQGTYFVFELSNGKQIFEPAHFTKDEKFGLYKLFASARYNRNACYQCRYKQPGRVGHITLGDIPISQFSSILNDYKSDIDINRGISIVSKEKVICDFVDDGKQVSFIKNIPAFSKSVVNQNKMNFLNSLSLKRIIKKEIKKEIHK